MPGLRSIHSDKADGAIPSRNPDAERITVDDPDDLAAIGGSFGRWIRVRLTSSSP
ncbi:MAG: hypothetical protein OXL36_16095 [Bryobacterales bacterium]|nr:hypothetical protein [Bryobacterales bacterium]MDE0295492.1 hypothetical protein [Bryobacterales bacterium]